MRRHWLLGLVAVFLLLVIGSYVLYQWQPRLYPFLWARFFAHVHAGIPGAPNCVPNDFPTPWGDWDHNDGWAAPPSTHSIQHLEWLGECVSQEPTAHPADTFDDGLRAIEASSQGAWQPKSQFRLRTMVSTSYSEHKRYFQAGNILLTVFADWNDNNTFESDELIHSWVGLPPFSFAPNGEDFTLVTTPWIDVAEDYATPGNQPKFRFRLTYFRFHDEQDLNPGGHNDYGEVEDIRNVPPVED